MKKLFISLILFTLFTSVFAAPKIPKSSNGFDIKDKLSSKDNFAYISNSGQNLYAVRGIVSNISCDFEFTNYSYITKIEIKLVLHCSNEEDLDALLAKIDTSDLENEFIKIRRSFIRGNIKPVIFVNEEDFPEIVMYQGTL